MRRLTEYEIAKILNKMEVDYIEKMRETGGDNKSFNINAVYIVREVRKKINKYLDKKHES